MSTGPREGGEEALIAATFAPLAAGFEGAFGLLDDCAQLTPTPGHDLVLSTDAVAAGVHFFPDDAPEDIAWKALAVNVSDLVAKGARPRCYLLAVAFPDRPEPLWLQRLAAGLAEAQAAYGIVLAGGDTDLRASPLSLTITAVGEVAAGRMVRRATGKAGDLLYVSGTLGASALGLRLRQDASLAERLGLGSDEVGELVQRYLRPRPPLAVAPLLPVWVSAAMDVSDGLAKDLARLARASGLGAEVRAEAVPVTPAFRSALARAPAVIEAALAGGDDYEVLAAVSPERAAGFEAAARDVGVAVAEIGHLTHGEGVKILDASGREIVLDRPGYDHFA